MSVRSVFFSLGNRVAGWVNEDGSAHDLPISIYPSAHSDDSISIVWSIGIEQAERLASDILAAVKAVREAQSAVDGVTTGEAR